MKQILLFIIILLVYIGCTNHQNMALHNNLAVNWELISNTYSNGARAKAVFTVKNNSSITLMATDWILYFNMAPRIIIPSSDSALAEVIHISGDLYKLLPRKNLKLKSGFSVDIYYEFYGWQIKESDAPAGLYFVYRDSRNNEEIVLPQSYTIIPFTREEQIKRSKNDYEPLPTPENRYYGYLKNHTNLKPSPLPFIPSPFKLESGYNAIILDNRYSISYDPDLEFNAKFLSKKLNEIAGLKLPLIKSSRPFINTINLMTKSFMVNSDADESYQLEIRENSITISGSDVGVFYGIQTLLNLIPFEVYKEKPGCVELPSLYIEDAPRFHYRGLHIDVCRNFQSKEQILKILDLMAFYKLNVLHLYLSEDEGWRLEIEELPELTEIGSKRGHTLSETDFLHPSYGSGPFPDSENNHGSGYYTRKDFKEIIQFAHERHISVIPCINLPGHARAAIKAMEVRYNRYKEKAKIAEANEFRLIDPDDQSNYLSAQFYNDNVVCVARESVYHFFGMVIDDIIEMYKEADVPLTMIHTGGDEVPEGAWTQSPLCIKLITENTDISDSKNLQQYFFRRITKILSNHNLKAGGWEEVALTKDKNWNYSVNPEFAGGNIIPYIWNNLEKAQDLAYRIANAGYPVVLCPVSNFYFDLAYDNDPLEPGLYWGGFNNERDAWEFAPFNMFITTTKTSMGKLMDTEKEYAGMKRLQPEAYKNIIGLQAELWHETIKGADMMEYYLLPKLISFAERCWSKSSPWVTISSSDKRNKAIDAEWLNFNYTLYNYELPKLHYLNGGYNYHIPPAGAIMKDGYYEAIAVCQDLIIRYTTDGTDPSENSSIYTQSLPANNIIKLRVFDKAGQTSRIITVQK